VRWEEAKIIRRTRTRFHVRVDESTTVHTDHEMRQIPTDEFAKRWVFVIERTLESETEAIVELNRRGGVGGAAPETWPSARGSRDSRRELTNVGRTRAGNRRGNIGTPETHIVYSPLPRPRGPAPDLAVNPPTPSRRLETSGGTRQRGGGLTEDDRGEAARPARRSLPWAGRSVVVITVRWWRQDRHPVAAPQVAPRPSPFA
jgi:hypothetical protein